MTDDPVHNHPDMAWDMAETTAKHHRCAFCGYEILDKIMIWSENSWYHQRCVQAAFAPPPPNSKE